MRRDAARSTVFLFDVAVDLRAFVRPHVTPIPSHANRRDRSPISGSISPSDQSDPIRSDPTFHLPTQHIYSSFLNIITTRHNEDIKRMESSNEHYCIIIALLNFTTAHFIGRNSRAIFMTKQFVVLQQQQPLQTTIVLSTWNKSLPFPTCDCDFGAFFK